MRVLVLFAHPVETSFAAALHQRVVHGLEEAGHEVDDCDLYAEGFDPVLSRHERLTYADTGADRSAVQRYIDRLSAAEALVISSPVWNLGFPAILKGFLDRVFLPGVSFRFEDGRLVPALHNIRKVAAVTTYGMSRLHAFLIGDPPRKVVTRLIRMVVRPGSPVMYLARYGMDRIGGAEREAFLDRVTTQMRRF